MQDVFEARGPTTGLTDALVNWVYVYPDNLVKFVWKMKYDRTITARAYCRLAHNGLDSLELLETQPLKANHNHCVGT